MFTINIRIYIDLYGLIWFCIGLHPLIFVIIKLLKQILTDIDVYWSTCCRTNLPDMSSELPCVLLWGFSTVYYLLLPFHSLGSSCCFISRQKHVPRFPEPPSVGIRWVLPILRSKGVCSCLFVMSQLVSTVHIRNTSMRCTKHQRPNRDRSDHIVIIICGRPDDAR